MNKITPEELEKQANTIIKKREYNRLKQAEYRAGKKKQGIALNNPEVRKRADSKYLKENNLSVVTIRADKKSIEIFKDLALSIGCSQSEFFELIVNEFNSKR